MKSGVIQQVATPAKLYDQPESQFVAGFIGSPPMNFFAGTLARNGSGMVFRTEIDGFTVHLENQMAARLTGHADKKIILGLRPENILEKSRSPDSPSEWGSDALTENIEPMGAETHLHATIGANSFVVRLPGGWRMEHREKIPLVFDMRHAHFFDAATGKEISR
jgi:multiple sugar transport system ATP-binding protein